MQNNQQVRITEGPHKGKIGTLTTAGAAGGHLLPGVQASDTAIWIAGMAGPVRLFAHEPVELPVHAEFLADPDLVFVRLP